MKPLRLHPGDDMVPVHALLTAAFAFMAGRIDPPSSLLRMTPATLSDEAASKELWVIPGPSPRASLGPEDAPNPDPARPPLACVILTPQPDHLYIGKLAVAAQARGQGLARQLIELADTRARALGLPRLRLQTRVELVENHATFTHLGFVQTGETAHEGYDRPTSLTFDRPVQPG